MKERSPQQLKQYLRERMEWVRDSNDFRFKTVEVEQLLEWLDIKGLFDHNKTERDIIHYCRNQLHPQSEIARIANAPAAYPGADELKTRGDDGNLKSSELGDVYKGFMSRVKDYFSQNFAAVIEYKGQEDNYHKLTLRMDNKGSLILKRIFDETASIKGGFRLINDPRSELIFQFKDKNIAADYFKTLKDKLPHINFRMAAEDKVIAYDADVMKRHISAASGEISPELGLKGGIPASVVSLEKPHKPVEKPARTAKSAGMSQKEWDKKTGQGRLF